jgi:hypothetical protein
MKMHGMTVKAQGRFGLFEEIVGYRPMRAMTDITVFHDRGMFINEGTFLFRVTAETGFPPGIIHGHPAAAAVNTMAVQAFQFALPDRVMRGHEKG